MKFHLALLTTYMNIISAMIIELFGLPGSGKTTCISQLRSVLDKECVVILKQEKNYIHTYNAKVHEIAVILSKPSVLICIYKLLCTCGFTKNNLLLLYRILSYTIALNKIVKVNDIVIIDEGLTQYIGSLYATSYSTSYDYILSIFELLPMNRMNYFYCKLGVDESYDRVIRRNNKKTRIEKVSDIEAKNQLNSTMNYFDKLSILMKANNYNIYLLDGNESVTEKVSILYKYIK